MDNVVPSDSKYVPLVQQPYCCMPTCIQMVMLRHNIPLVPAELLGHHLGLIVPGDKVSVFYKPRTGSRPKAGYGTQAGKKYSPNTVFKTLKIPLKMNWSLINKFKNLNSFKKYLANIGEKDYLICFDWKTLWNKGTNHGHVCVLDKVYLNNDEVRIIDPSPDDPKWRTVKIERLYDAMKIHGKENGDGFWEISQI